MLLLRNSNIKHRKGCETPFWKEKGKFIKGGGEEGIPLKKLWSALTHPLGIPLKKLWSALTHPLALKPTLNLLM